MSDLKHENEICNQCVWKQREIDWLVSELNETRRILSAQDMSISFYLYRFQDFMKEKVWSIWTSFVHGNK